MPQCRSNCSASTSGSATSGKRCSRRRISASTPYLTEGGIQIYDLTARLKTPQSLEEKLRRKGPYSYLQEVTDLVGLRVITYLSLIHI